MAKRKYRLENISADDKAELQNLIGSFSPYQEELLNALESGDDKDIDFVLSAVKGRFGDQTDSVKGRIKSLSSRLPAKKDALEKFIKSQGNNETGLTDAELQDRQEAYKGLSGETENLDRNSVNAKIKGFISQGNVGEILDMKAGENTLSNIITDFVTQNYRLPGYFELEKIAQEKSNDPTYQQLVRQLKGNGNLTNFLNNQNITNEIAGLTKKYDTDSSVSRIQDILNSRMSESQKQAALDQFLAETPESLRADRESYLAELEDMAGSHLRERAVPSILNELNRRGTVDSPGEFSSAIAAEAGGLQGRIEETARTLEEQDNIFFADAAYRLTTSRLEATEQQYRDQVAAERTRVRQDQGQGFASREGQLARDFEQDMLRREQDRSLRLRSSELNFDSDRKASDTRTSLLAETASSGASIIGNKLIYGGRQDKEQTPSEKASGAPAVSVKPVPRFIG